MPNVDIKGIHPDVLEDGRAHHALSGAVRRAVGLWVGPTFKPRDVAVYLQGAEYFEQGPADPQTVVAQFPGLVDRPERTLLWRQGLALEVAAAVLTQLYPRMPELLWVEVVTHPMPPFVDGRALGLAQLPGPNATSRAARGEVMQGIERHREFVQSVVAGLTIGEITVQDSAAEITRWEALDASLAAVVRLFKYQGQATA